MRLLFTIVISLCFYTARAQYESVIVQSHLGGRVKTVFQGEYDKQPTRSQSIQWADQSLETCHNIDSFGHVTSSWRRTAGYTDSATYRYDKQGRLLHAINKKYISGTAQPVVFNIFYAWLDSSNVSLTTISPSDTFRFSISYTYNNNGQIVRENITGAMRNKYENNYYEYDPNGRLLSHSYTDASGGDTLYVLRYKSYDKYGNPTQASAQTGKANINSKKRVYRYTYY